MRVAWLSTLLILSFGSVMAYVKTQDEPKLIYRGTYLRHRPLTMGIILGALLIAEILAIAATYATPERPLLWQASLLLSSFGEIVFPLIGKYATRVTPPLQPEVLYKVQAVTTLFMLAGAVITIAILPHIILMSDSDQRFLEKVQSRVRGGSNWLTRNPLILVPFAVLIGFDLFFGWFEFDPDPAYLTHKKCLLKAACYAHDDLHLIATDI